MRPSVLIYMAIDHQDAIWLQFHLDYISQVTTQFKVENVSFCGFEL